MRLCLALILCVLPAAPTLAQQGCAPYCDPHPRRFHPVPVIEFPLDWQPAPGPMAPAEPAQPASPADPAQTRQWQPGDRLTWRPIFLYDYRRYVLPPLPDGHHYTAIGRDIYEIGPDGATIIRRHR